jgi:Uma2 family endonuclease
MMQPSGCAAIGNECQRLNGKALGLGGRMAVARLRPKLYSAAEYLALEEAAEQRQEYYQGEIFAMAGGSFNHEMIAGNLYAALHSFARANGCFAFTSNMRLMVEAHDLYTYPDAMLVCGKPKFLPGRTDTVLNPLLLVEVLSKSTQNYDRGQKFEFYRSITTFAEYLLVDQDRIYLEHYHRLALGSWQLTEYREIDAAVKLQTVDLTIPVRQLYEQVDWFAG